MRDSCLIIGAGMAGVTAAIELVSRGVTCTLLDKGRQPGGRMATRCIGSSVFDHGAQFFTARDVRFRAQVAQWLQQGWVTPWFSKNGETCYRGVGGMNNLMQQLAKPLKVRTGVLVTQVAHVDGSWRVTSDAGEQWHASKLLVTLPAPQALPLLSEVAGLVVPLSQISYEPCFTLMAVLDGPSRIPLPGFLRPENDSIAWVADNARKGLSSGVAALTIQARPGFSRHHLETPQNDVAAMLLEAAQPWLGARVVDWQLHRWRYARPAQHQGELFLKASGAAPVAVAGDMFGGPRVEGAFISGMASAQWLAT